MKYLSWFVFDFIFVYIIYYIFVIRKSNKKDKMPSEARYLVNYYKLDTKKFSYRKFLFLISLVSSFDISLILLVVTAVNGIAWQITFGILAILPVALISFMLLGKYYQNKQLKDNSKEIEKEKAYLKKKKDKEKNKNKKGKMKNVK